MALFLDFSLNNYEHARRQIELAVARLSLAKSVEKGGKRELLRTLTQSSYCFLAKDLTLDFFLKHWLVRRAFSSERIHFYFGFDRNFKEQFFKNARANLEGNQSLIGHPCNPTLA